MTPQLLAQSIVLGLLTGGVYALMASGLTIVFGIMRVVNVAQGAIVVMGAYISWLLFTTFGLDPLLSIVVIVPLFFVAGALTERTIMQRTSDRDLTLTVLVTFGIAIILEGLQGTLWGSNFQQINPEYATNSVAFGDIYVPLVRLLAGLISLALLGGLYLILSGTNLGRAIRATTQDARNASLVGVNVERVRMIAFGIGVAMAAAGGPLLGILYSFYPDTHWLWIGKLLAIVVLGGLGSLRGMFVAALLLGLAEQVMAVSISLDWSPIVFYVFLFGVLIVRPQGLMGSVARESL